MNLNLSPGFFLSWLGHSGGQVAHFCVSVAEGWRAVEISFQFVLYLSSDQGEDQK